MRFHKRLPPLKPAGRRQYGSTSQPKRYSQLNRPLAYGVVFRAQELSSSKIIALKQLRVPHEERQNGVPITALREISILRSLRHENIVNVLEVAVGVDAMDDVYMVMEYCEQVSDTCLPRGDGLGCCA